MLCKVCNVKISFFTKWSNHGLCNNCFLKLQTVKRSLKIIHDSSEIIKKTKNPETGISRVLLIMFHLDNIEPFNEAGIVDLPCGDMRSAMYEYYNHFKKRIEIVNQTKKKKIVIPEFSEYKTLYSMK